MVRKVVSGGQTGADRGALEAALAAGVAHGGWCPRGRRAEDGEIPGRFQLDETPSGSYAERTERNVLDSDATLLITRGAPAGGSALTARLARRHKRPLLHLDLDRPLLDPAGTICAWLDQHRVEVLNVAGPRESTTPGIFEQVRALLEEVLARDATR